MTVARLTLVLDDHHVPWRVAPTYDRQDASLAVMALDVVTGPRGEDASSWVDVTDWTAERLSKWLGY